MGKQFKVSSILSEDPDSVPSAHTDLKLTINPAPQKDTHGIYSIKSGY